MENDFEIEIQEDETEETAGVQLPLNFLSFGEIESDDVKVYIKQDVYKQLEKFAASNTEKELGSILLGEYCQEHGKTHVIISHCIEAKYTDASASTLTFTHETWDYVHKEHGDKYPDKKIIGWQHTHPNYGIFLSNYDMFIQENFFNLPFQVAYVIDPIQNLRGFFQWKNGRVEKLKGYYIYDDVSKPIKIEQTKRKKEEEKPTKTPKAAIAVIGLLCLLTVFLAGFAISLHGKYQAQLEKQKESLDCISDQQALLDLQETQLNAQKAQLDDNAAVIQNQTDTITQMQTLLQNGVLSEDGKTTAAELIQLLENQEQPIPGQKELIQQLQALQAQAPQGSSVTFEPYTVAAGDTLTGICEKKGLDYGANYRIILALNGIKDADQIYAGQSILLPVTK